VRLRPRRRIALGVLAVAAVAVAWLALINGGARRPRIEAHRRFSGSAEAASGLHRPRQYTSPVPEHVITRTVTRSRAQTLTLQQLAGQRVIYAYSGLQPPASLLAVIRAGEAAGVIFFAPNISDPSQIHGVINHMQQASLTSPVHTRLLMLVDQEGGEVRRLPGAPLLSEKQIGESANPVALAGMAGASAAQDLAEAGMNVNLAPVLDVYRQPGNFIDQFQRSYSSDSAEVASLGGRFIAAQQLSGIAATAKHFPGLGAATQRQNTDSGPVVLNQSLPILRSVDEQPYRTAIASGVKLVMASWAIYPALDPQLPAGLSAAVLQGELRHRLRFHGVTITDGIDAGAVTPFGDLAERSVLAAKAGADLILCAAQNPEENTPAQGIAVMHAIAAAIADHQLSAAAARQAVRRSLALRARP
jgi:beta-N-acetylhexosaminidase